MQNPEDGHHHVGVGAGDAAAAPLSESASVAPSQAIVVDDNWENVRADEDDAIMQQQSAIQPSEAHQSPFVGNKVNIPSPSTFLSF